MKQVNKASKILIRSGLLLSTTVLLPYVTVKAEEVAQPLGVEVTSNAIDNSAREVNVLGKEEVITKEEEKDSIPTEPQIDSLTYESQNEVNAVNDIEDGASLSQDSPPVDIQSTPTDEAATLKPEENLNGELSSETEENQEEEKNPRVELTNDSVSVTPPPTTTKFVVTYTPKSELEGMKELSLLLENGKWRRSSADDGKVNIDHETGKATILFDDIQDGGFVIATAFSGENGVDFLGTVTQRIKYIVETENPKTETPRPKEETPQNSNPNTDTPKQEVPSPKTDSPNLAPEAELGYVYIQYFSFENGKVELLQGKTELGRTVEGQEVLQGDIGTNYNTKAVRPQSITDANGAKWILSEESTDGQEEGVFGTEIPSVTYYYTRYSEVGSVEIWYVDETGTVLKTETAAENQAVNEEYDVSGKKQAEITVGNKVYILVKGGEYPIGTVGEDGNLIRSNQPDFIGVDPIKGKILPGVRTVAFVYQLVGELSDPQLDVPKQESPLSEPETPQTKTPKQESPSLRSERPQAGTPKQEIPVPKLGNSQAGMPKQETLSSESEKKQVGTPKQKLPSAKLEKSLHVSQKDKKLPDTGEKESRTGIIGSFLFILLAAGMRLIKKVRKE
ncbi:hypothetical protein DDV21_005695 [Streptococcus chenjunshii]|uniref:Gram-positive cocci surface proteins LPxTG domain-containing protein n=1 Tax=Streptococcus chenjunshii TaxID=2173853 RepID=A0A372KPB9_9STRE|nr:MucBP domain-containing protein [Streptococcus chenjunshii]AXQ78607.1 hypothetical protein DDV21_005695 [Streptococcus chenjunshii]RFU51929.1 hypothetical protein DDV22_00350 [Streptococcus chenjunshii]RFU54121.1 hypothetical protein DDV23_00905 [Streptococcus chenjunshii]